MTFDMRKCAWPLMTEQYSKVDFLHLSFMAAEGHHDTLTAVVEVDEIIDELLLLNDFDAEKVLIKCR